MKILKTAWVTLVVLTLTAPAFAGHHGKKMDVVDTAAAAGTFETLIAAAKAAGFVEVLKGDGPLTVFAPGDDAADAIRVAIDRGVPLFNHGNAQGTVAVYKSVAEKLMREGSLTAEERVPRGGPHGGWQRL